MATFSGTGRIIIVGAGASGLLLARQLKRRGFREVVLLEQGTSVASSTKTITVDGRAIDIATKFVPAVTLSGHGVFAPLRALLDEYGAELVPTRDAMFYDPRSRQRQLRPPFMAAFSKREILTGFVRGFELLERIEGMASIAQVLASGIVRPQETLIGWGKRHRVESFATFIAFLSDVFSGGPSIADNAAYPLKSRVHFLGGYFQRAFFQSPLLPPALRLYARLRAPEGKLQRFLASPPSGHGNFVLARGYGHFFATLAEREELDVRFGCDLTRVLPAAPGRPTVRVELRHAPPLEADAVLFTCPPWEIGRLLGRDSPTGQLFQVDPPPRTIQSWIFRAKNWPAHALGASGLLLDGRNMGRLGTADVAFDGRPYAISKEFPDSDVMVAPVYRGPELTDARAEERLVSGVREYGIDVTQLLASSIFVYPRCIPQARCASGWFDEVSALQGVGGLFFLGEAFSGQGIPAITAHVEAFAARYAPAAPSERKRPSP